jgi:hypothetical protein
MVLADWPILTKSVPDPPPIQETLPDPSKLPECPKGLVSKVPVEIAKAGVATIVNSAITNSTTFINYSLPN